MFVHFVFVNVSICVCGCWERERGWVYSLYSVVDCGESGIPQFSSQSWSQKLLFLNGKHPASLNQYTHTHTQSRREKRVIPVFLYLRFTSFSLIQSPSYNLSLKHAEPRTQIQLETVWAECVCLMNIWKFHLWKSCSRSILPGRDKKQLLARNKKLEDTGGAREVDISQWWWIWVGPITKQKTRKI